MGWSSGGEVFDPMAEMLIRFVDEERVTVAEATELLAVLARSLFERDWDTPDESLYEARSHPIVVAALRAAGWEPDCES